MARHQVDVRYRRGVQSARGRASAPGKVRRQRRLGRAARMRILIRTSKWAIWARRFGSLALPLAVVPVFMHRERMITSDDFHVIELVAMGVAALALVLALGAFVRLWVTGDHGWGKAVTGLIFSLICLAPAVFLFMQTVR